MIDDKKGAQTEQGDQNTGCKEEGGKECHDAVSGECLGYKRVESGCVPELSSVGAEQLHQNRSLHYHAATFRNSRSTEKPAKPGWP